EVGRVQPSHPFVFPPDPFFDSPSAATAQVGSDEGGGDDEDGADQQRHHQRSPDGIGDGRNPLHESHPGSFQEFDQTGPPRAAQPVAGLGEFIGGGANDLVGGGPLAPHRLPGVPSPKGSSSSGEVSTASPSMLRRSRAMSSRS